LLASKLDEEHAPPEKIKAYLQIYQLMEYREERVRDLGICCNSIACLAAKSK